MTRLLAIAYTFLVIAGAGAFVLIAYGIARLVERQQERLDR